MTSISCYVETFNSPLTYYTYYNYVCYQVHHQGIDHDYEKRNCGEEFDSCLKIIYEASEFSQLDCIKEAESHPLWNVRNRLYADDECKEKLETNFCFEDYCNQYIIRDEFVPEEREETNKGNEKPGQSLTSKAADNTSNIIIFLFSCLGICILSIIGVGFYLYSKKQLNYVLDTEESKVSFKSSKLSMKSYGSKSQKYDLSKKSKKSEISAKKSKKGKIDDENEQSPIKKKKSSKGKVRDAAAEDTQALADYSDTPKNEDEIEINVSEGSGEVKVKNPIQTIDHDQPNAKDTETNENNDNSIHTNDIYSDC